MVKLPKKLKMWGHEYEVKHPHIFQDANKPLHGSTNLFSHKILIDDKDTNGNPCSESAVWTILFHEFIHIIEHHTGHQVFLLEGDEHNEEAIDAHAEAWYMILNNNGLLKKP